MIPHDNNFSIQQLVGDLMALDAQMIVIALIACGHLPRMSIAKLSKIPTQQYSGDFVEAPGLLLARVVVDGSICMTNVVSALFASILGTCLTTIT